MNAFSTGHACAWLLLVACSASCAPMIENRTETVLSSSKVRVHERRAPQLDVAEVEAYVDGTRVIARTRLQTTCLVRDAQTRQIREHIERKKDLWAVGTEVTLAVIGAGILAGGLYGVSKNCGKEGGDCGFLFPIMPTAVGGLLFAGAGTAAVVDIAKGSVEDRTRTETSPASQELAAACSGSEQRRHKVSITFPSGTASAQTDDSGIATLPLPPGTRLGPDGALDVEIKLNDRPAQRVRISSAKAD